MPVDEINYWKTLIFENSIIVEPMKKHDAIKSHPPDNKFIDVAVESGADYIVSGDKHLLTVGSFGKIKIVTAKKMAELLG